MKELENFTVERLEEIILRKEPYDINPDDIDALAKIALAGKVSEPSDNWIKCSDRMPEEGQHLIYYFEPIGIHSGTYEGDNLFVSSTLSGFLRGDVTHWQPLPEPPNSKSSIELCKWTYDEHGYKWDSACGESWQFTDGDPEDNHVRFCQGCGKAIFLTDSKNEE